MRSHAGVAAQMFQALADKGINILAITTSEIKISVLIDTAYAELAVRTLHTFTVSTKNDRLRRARVRNWSEPVLESGGAVTVVVTRRNT